MTDIFECLDGLVGLTDIECDCIEDERPEDWNESDSGLYLTDFEDGIPLNTLVFSTAKCFGGQTVWEVMQRALNQATKDFVRDLKASIYGAYDSNLQVFSGCVGKQKVTGSLSISEDYTGATFEVKKAVKGACWTINEIGLGLNCNAEVEVLIYEASNPSNILHTETIQAVAGEFVKHALSTPLQLPLQSDNCDKLKYVIAYDLPDGCDPLNSKFRCCSDKFAWEKYFNAKGFSSNDLSITGKCTNYSNGLSVCGFLQCDGLKWICDLDEIQGYSVKDVISKTIQYRAVSKLISAICDSGNINFYTLLAPEKLIARQQGNNTMYVQNITWITQNLPLHLTDCFKCKTGKIGRRYSNLI